MLKRYIIVVAVVYIQTSTDISFGQILPPSGGDQGFFSPTLTAPTDSCYTFSPSEVSARYCGLVCLQHSRETYLFGVDHSKGLCACCDYPLLPKVQDTAWCSYQRKCPPCSRYWLFVLVLNVERAIFQPFHDFNNYLKIAFCKFFFVTLEKDFLRGTKSLLEFLKVYFFVF